MHAYRYVCTHIYIYVDIHEYVYMIHKYSVYMFLCIRRPLGGVLDLGGLTSPFPPPEILSHLAYWNLLHKVGQPYNSGPFFWFFVFNRDPPWTPQTALDPLTPLHPPLIQLFCPDCNPGPHLDNPGPPDPPAPPQMLDLPTLTY